MYDNKNIVCINIFKAKRDIYWLNQLQTKMLLQKLILLINSVCTVFTLTLPFHYKFTFNLSQTVLKLNEKPLKYDKENKLTFWKF